MGVARTYAMRADSIRLIRSAGAGDTDDGLGQIPFCDEVC